MANAKRRIALITGASGGIGRAVVRKFLQSGIAVALADQSEELVQDLLAEAAALEVPAMAFCGDLLDANYSDQLPTRVHEAMGSLDILINNAALFSAAPTVEIERKDFDKLYAVNVAGSLFTAQAVAKHMIERGEGGKIINMASQAGRRGEPLVAVYCSTKAAIISLTQSLGLDLIKHGINVNAISPGVVDGEHWDIVDAFFAKYENLQPGEKKKQVAKGVPHGRMGVAEDLTGMAVFLASSDADYIVAQTYNVDGGQWMS